MRMHCKNMFVVTTCSLKEVDETGFFFLFVVCHRDYGCDYREAVSHMSLVTNVIGGDLF